MVRLSLSQTILDSIKFTFKNHLTVFGLGVIFVFLSFFDFYFDVVLKPFPILALICILMLFFFSIIEAGINYRIFVKSINRLNYVPLNKFKELFHHGFIDLIITSIYGFALVILLCCLTYPSRNKPSVFSLL